MNLLLLVDHQVQLWFLQNILKLDLFYFCRALLFPWILKFLYITSVFETGNIDFDEISFSLKKVPIGNLERRNTSSNTYVVGDEVQALPNTTFLIGEAVNQSKYCRGRILAINGNESFDIGFFIGVIPISKKIVQLIFKARYDGSDNPPKSNANCISVSSPEATKYSSEFTCAWSMRTAFQLLDLPNNANHF
mmetsp:Transcript_30759/g.29372  ORF Transcript_30759/g.29372 Transcript_30759/m.29372 type:complete len:192 (+) Transcript_30759:64-639(+)